MCFLGSSRVNSRFAYHDLIQLLNFRGFYSTDWTMSNYGLNMLPVYVVVAATGTLPQILANIHELLKKIIHRRMLSVPGFNAVIKVFQNTFFHISQCLRVMLSLL